MRTHKRTHNHTNTCAPAYLDGQQVSAAGEGQEGVKLGLFLVGQALNFERRVLESSDWVPRCLASFVFHYLRAWVWVWVCLCVRVRRARACVLHYRAHARVCCTTVHMRVRTCLHIHNTHAPPL